MTYIQRLLLATGRGARFYGKHSTTSLPLEGEEYLKQRTIYIRRTLLAEAWPGPFVASGASTFEVSDPFADDSVWLAVKVLDSTSLPVPMDDGPHSRSYARFFFLPRSLAPIKAFAGNIDPANRHWSTEHLSAILMMLRLSRSIISDPHSLPTFYHYGYVTANAGFWKEYLAVHFAAARSFVSELLPTVRVPTSPDLLVHKIQTLPGGIWPIRRGAGIRVDGERVTIDLYGITASLKDHLTIHSSAGELGQPRGRAFEDDVQAAIDGTTWRPPAYVAALRRRKLRLGGQDLTDIDAVAVRDNRLLIVSCKSKGLTPQLETASVAATRNAESMIEAAYVDAIRLEDLLRVTRQGDNFDFSGFEKILVHVCIPYPLFVAADRLLEPVRNGLMRCASLAELHTWLSLGSVDLDDPLGHRVITPIAPAPR